MENFNITDLVQSFCIVIALIAIFAFCLRKIESVRHRMSKKKSGRITIEEKLYIDPSNKLVLIKDIQNEHLIFMGKNTEFLVRTNKKNVP